MKYILVLLLLPVLLFASPVALQNATATFSQSSYSISGSIDGTINASGWATDPQYTSQAAAWETFSDLNASNIQFSMYHMHGGKHLIGRFKFSVTSDSRSTFADAAVSGGDVTANWTTLINPSITLPSGMTYTVLADNSILVSGTIPDTGVYHIGYSLPIANITGIRLDVLTHSSLPFGVGPGYCPSNGNFVLSELLVDATNVPELSSFLLLSFFMLFVFRKFSL